MTRNTPIKWLGNARPIRWGLKREIPAHSRHLGIRVSFPFELAWIMRDHSGKVAFEVDGAERWAETWEFFLHTTPEGAATHVIGLRDLSTADNTPFAEAWRQAGHARIVESLSLRT